MKQAKVLTDVERKRLLSVIASDKHAARNRLAVMLSFLAGLFTPTLPSHSLTAVAVNSGPLSERM
jgi:integrase/recombinase XerD